MDYRKLFQVLVVGGAMVGGATGCDKTAEAAEKSKDAGATGAADAGSAQQGGGGGVQGW